LTALPTNTRIGARCSAALFRGTLAALAFSWSVPRTNPQSSILCFRRRYGLLQLYLPLPHGEGPLHPHFVRGLCSLQIGLTYLAHVCVVAVVEVGDLHFDFV